MIDPSKITAVLLGNGWIEVKPGTFSTGSFEISSANSPIAAYRGGAAFTVVTSDGAEVTAPLGSLQAVKSGGQTTVRKGRPPKDTTQK